MSSLFFNNNRKNIFDIIREADDDDQATNADQGANDAQAADATTDDNQNQDTGDDQTADQGTDDEMGSDEDFDVDTTMDDDGGEDDAGDDTGGDDSTMDSSGGSSFGDDEAEVNKTNTNIFSSLTKEEQAIKIKELKRLYKDLYIYVGDMYNKMNDIYPDENNIESIYRVTASLYDLRKNIAEYIDSIFDTKSYIENDVAYNRYLTIIQSISTIINSLYSEIVEKQGKN